MNMITKILTLALATSLCFSTAGMTALGKTESKNAYQKVSQHFDDWEDDFFGDDWDDWAPPDPASMKQINSKQWAVSGITTIEATYVTDSIALFPSPTQEILLKEYLSEDSPTYDAKTSISNSTLKIEVGARPQPAHTGYSSRIELYIPSGFRGVIKPTTKTGIISINGITASRLIARSVNGSIEVSNFSGILDCKTETGGIQVSQGEAMGIFRTENGCIDLCIDKMLGDIEVSTRTGLITAALPKNGAFAITASTDTGFITNDFSESWSVIKGSVTGATLTGVWGESPSVNISLVNSNGSIDIQPAADDGKKFAALSESALQEYQRWGVTYQSEQLFYQGEAIRIFMDLQANNSFAYFAYNESGIVDLKLTRGQDGAIVSAASIPKEEAEMILNHLQSGYATVPSVANGNSSWTEKALEDISRLVKEDLSDDVRASLNSCTGNEWYVILAGNRRYIYFDNLPNNYAYQYNPKENIVTVMDIGKSKEGYVLLSIPAGSQLSIQYNSKSVSFTQVSVS